MSETVFAEIVTRRYVRCPREGCHGEWGVEHLLSDETPGGRSWGPWSCNEDDCDVVISGKLTARGVELTVTKREEPRGLALLKFGDLWLVVDEKWGRIERDHADFFYHSHQCPTNLLHKVRDVFDGDGSDPHGRLRYVASIEASPEAQKRVEDAHSLAELFAIFDTDGVPPDSEWPEKDRGMLPIIAQWQREAAKRGDA